MLNPPLLEGLDAAVIDTPRLRTHVITRGAPDGEPVILVHGNASAARFFEELMLAMPAGYRVIAPDLRGYGRSEAKPLDATRGVRDFSDDLAALVQTLGLERFHLAGWSLGGNVAMQYTIDHPQTVATLTLIAPGSPYGVGGSHGLYGQPNNPEFSGSGGGIVNAELVQRIAAGDRSAESPFSPRNVKNSLYYKPPFRAAREEVFLSEMLSTVTGPDNYPGDMTPTESWPGVGPGTRGLGNALAPKYCNQSGLAAVRPQPPILWIRGDSDAIISDTSTLDLGILGQMGLVPGWPGPEVFPAQPMVSQMRAVLDSYSAQSGSYREVVLPDCGHSPHIEQPEAFHAAFFPFLRGA